MQTVAKVCVVHDGSVLLLRRSQNEEQRRGEWDIPGGSVELGERDIEGCVREAYEEAGLRLRPSDMVPVFVPESMQPPGRRRRMYIVWLEERPLVRLSEEHTEFQWCGLDDLPQVFDHPVWPVLLLRYLREAEQAGECVQSPLSAVTIGVAPS